MREEGRKQGRREEGGRKEGRKEGRNVCMLERNRVSSKDVMKKMNKNIGPLPKLSRAIGFEQKHVRLDYLKVYCVT